MGLGLRTQGEVTACVICFTIKLEALHRNEVVARISLNSLLGGGTTDAGQLTPDLLDCLT